MKTSHSAKTVVKQLQTLADPNRAALQQRYFKVGEGQYGAHDRFMGITVPTLRQLAKTFSDLPFSELTPLFKSTWHEQRALATMILTNRYQKTKDVDLQKKSYEFYIDNFSAINNWDLVDMSAYQVVGHYSYHHATPKNVRQWANSADLWERRLAIVATFYFIRLNAFTETLWLAKHYLSDKEDLIHKATGWMLREVAKRDPDPVRVFLRTHYTKLPRTTLRYAIERFSDSERIKWLRGEI